MKWIPSIILLFFGFLLHPVWADDLDDLSELSDETVTGASNNISSAADELGDDLGDDPGDSDTFSDETDDEMDDMEEAASLKITFGGYIKMLAYWNREKYSDLLWEMYQAYPTQPSDREISGFNNVGTRLQLKMEGYLGDHARLFSALNINYNTVGSIHDENAAANYSEKQNAEVRLVEAFVEIYESSRIWKIGPQLVTWSYLEGMEVPTDRVNVRDKSYKSTEYEDGKLPSTGILLTQKMGEASRFEVMMIPVAKTNIGMAFQDYLYADDTSYPEPKPNRAKWATRLTSTIGKLDWAVSYVEGTDPDPDLSATFGKKYNRIQSPGLDLQYNLSSWLAKLSYVNSITEDEDGGDPMIKNSWSKYVIGGEFSVSGSTINIYAGQHKVADYKTDAAAQQTNFLLGQPRERTDFISGHVSADFLTGNALNLVLMAANYWDDEGKSVQSVVRSTFKYKIADGLEVLFSPTYMDLMDNQFTDIQTEIKYSF